MSALCSASRAAEQVRHLPLVELSIIEAVMHIHVIRLSISSCCLDQFSLCAGSIFCLTRTSRRPYRS